jgi:pilus assembly protein CpaB
MRRSPRSVLAVGAAIVVGVVTVGVVFSDLAALHRRAGSLGQPRSVLVARRDLALGTTLGANDLRVVSRYATAVPANAVSTLDDAVGKIVAVPVVEGSVLQATQLTTTERDGLGGLVPVGYRAVRVRPEDGLQPPAGAVVDVIASLEVSIDSAAKAQVVAHAARVLAIDTAADGAATGADDGVGVTLLVTEEEARGIAFAAANGVVMLALAPPEDACCSSHG